MRPSWDTTWMNMADVVGRRSRCSLRQIGAVIVDRSNRPVAMGYNGPPAGMAVDDLSCVSFCPRAGYSAGEADLGRSDAIRNSDYSNCVSIHAEANALMFADRREYIGGTLYVTSVPCWDCGKLVANSGVRRVVFPEPTDSDAHRMPMQTIQMLQASGIEVSLASITR